MKKQYEVEIENLRSQREKEIADHKAREVELLTQLKEVKEKFYQKNIESPKYRQNVRYKDIEENIDHRAENSIRRGIHQEIFKEPPAKAGKIVSIPRDNSNQMYEVFDKFDQTSNKTISLQDNDTVAI